MTVTNTTPTETTNETPNAAQPIDNMGNPVNPDGTPAEPKAAPEGDTVESLQKALKDTKAELTKLQQGDPEPPAETPNEAPADLEIKVQEAKDNGVDFSKYTEEFSSSGELSEASYKELAAKGNNKETVDAYIQGRQAVATLETMELTKVVGGDDKLAPVLEWASGNMSEAEIAAYNETTQTGSLAVKKLALQGLYAKYTAANGQTPHLLAGDTGNTPQDTFKSQFEMTKAMEDPRYWNDPDYQKDVQTKVQRSKAAGTI